MLTEDTLIDKTLIENTLDELIQIMETNKQLFYKSYKSLPIEMYAEIERLSVSKSSLYKDICSKSRLVAETFHKSIK